ncbi:hypothetical protein M153_100071948 [Pseudoloma neurophilia]|uniref:Uncharacterized protein n=1 Tax=Pseudoloma neurophilia TaxID=146866 RepID=A0A0R0M703_9MICR|nr:hypothetical protein M153_100071948 [Pseudoloma neurophilia]
MNSNFLNEVFKNEFKFLIQIFLNEVFKNEFKFLIQSLFKKFEVY